MTTSIVKIPDFNLLKSSLLTDWQVQGDQGEKNTSNSGKNPRLAWLIAMFLPFGSMSALAADIPLLNHNYESDIIPHQIGKTNFISGWVNSGFGAVGVAIPKGDGEQFETLNNRGQVAYVGAGGRFGQMTPVDLLLGETYTLQYDIGRPKGASGHHFVARIKADGLVVAQTQSSSASIAEGEWGSQTLTFTATRAMPLGKKVVVEFSNLASNIPAAAEENEDENTTPDPAPNSSLVMLDDISLSSDGVGEVTESEVEEVVVINSVMQGDATLNLPEDFPNINTALASLNGIVIKKDSIVTIRVNNCGVNDPNTSIVVDHQQGQNIHIVGDVTNPDNCQLLFYNVNGILVSNSRLGLIDGFHIKGSETIGASGILSNKKANVTVGSNVWISDFNHGFHVESGAVLRANSTQSFSNVDSGYFAANGGYLRADHAESFSNTQEGFEAYQGGSIFADHSLSYNNLHHGFSAHRNGFIYAVSSTSQNNDDLKLGYITQHFSAMQVRDSRSTGHGRHYANGAYNHSYIERLNQHASGNGSNSSFGNFGSIVL